MQRKSLIVNGVSRCFMYESKDTLADALRRHGLTGTKVGCNEGQCGACSVILNDKLVRSCVRKMSNIPEDSTVLTIEGLGLAGQLHPIQQAFITCGAVQCGFCSPGFIMSAYALLKSNPRPGREEVRSWFTRHRNICRCTGYKPIVDGVMLAAEVMRGEKTMEDITYHQESEDIYGTRYPRPGALSRVLGACDFGDDIALKMPSSTVYLALVLSTKEHAEIGGIDISKAMEVPGVIDVITAADVQGTNMLSTPKASSLNYSSGMDHPIFCRDAVRYRGDVIAAVAARDREQARRGAELMEVSYRELPVYHDFVEAASADAMQIHSGTPNVYIEQPLTKGEDTRKVFEQAAYVVEGSFETTRQSHMPVEPDVLQAYWNDEGVLCIQNKSQNLYGNIGGMAKAVGLPKEKLRMMQNPVGGSFGYSMAVAPSAVAAVCCMKLDRPVSLTLSYAEQQLFTGKRAVSLINGRLACDQTGRITGMEFHMGIDNGAYGDTASTKITKTVRFFGYPYQVPNITGLSQVCYTNNAYGVAYRAFGSPQAYTCSEALMDMMAEKIGMDPFEFRYLNIAREGDLNPNSVPYMHYPMGEMMDQMRPYYRAALEDAKRFSTPERRRGVGISWGGYHVSKAKDVAAVALELNPDGSVTNYNTWEEMGQGADIGALVHTHRCLAPLKLRPEQIKLVQNDTGICPDTGSASASRSHYMAGWAIQDAANRLMEAMRKPDGTYRTYQEMAEEGIPTKYEGRFKVGPETSDIDPYDGHGYGSPAQNFILNLCEVEVETATGKTTVLSYRGLTDIGEVGSELAVEGQFYGGASHSIGFALTEQFSDLDKHVHMARAGIPTCNETPDDFYVEFFHDPREEGPQNSVGCAESFQSSGHVAVLNAIYNAVGVRIYSLPALPEKVKQAMERKAEGREEAPQKFNLGCDLYERVEALGRLRPQEAT
ncbi:Aldehyde oxidoreductase [Firmicutes bacterium ASF500]|nr:Aldehyde oxidoreductase [Firmicutes bacterium ASF500]